MDIIQLQDKQDGWRIHRFNSPEELRKALAEHGITVGRGVEIGPYTMLGDRVTLGDNVRLAEETVVSRDTTIGDNTTLAHGAFVSFRSKIGADCTLAEDSFVGPDVSVGMNTTLGKHSEVGEKCKLGNAVTVGSGSYVMDHSVLEDGCVVGNGTYIGNRSKAGFFTYIGNDVQLVREVIVQDGTQIADGKRVPAYSTVTRGSVQLEQERMQRAINQMKGNIKYDSIGTFTSLEGTRCVRAQIDGLWLPTVRVSNEDSMNFGKGTMTLKDMADKYIAPAYILNNIEGENRTAGIRR